MSTPAAAGQPPAPATPGVLHALRRGFAFAWPTLLLILAIDTAIACVLWIGDPRPFWHPLLTTQCYGLATAYCVNVARPWDSARPIRTLMLAVAAGALIGIVLVIVLKAYPLEMVRREYRYFGINLLAAWANGLLIALMFHVKFRETRAAAELHRSEAERHRLARQAVEAQLKLMQAQIEPHFLFNTLASVQYLTETDPAQANRLLGHLLAYLRAALPQLRADSSTLGKEAELVRAYLSILQMRIGPRLAFAIDIPEALATSSFPPNLLISLVENAIQHGIEPSADGGSVRVAARQDAERLEVSVTDTGRGLAGDPARSAPATPPRPADPGAPAVPRSSTSARGDALTSGSGVGLANVRERLATLYGERARFTLEPLAPRGTRATLILPLDRT